MRWILIHYPVDDAYAELSRVLKGEAWQCGSEDELAYVEFTDGEPPLVVPSSNTRQLEDDEEVFRLIAGLKEGDLACLKSLVTEEVISVPHSALGDDYSPGEDFLFAHKKADGTFRNLDPMQAVIDRAEEALKARVS